jgi:hypothetical protein
MIDLHALAADHYRITLDESYEASDRTRDDRLWCYRIPCKLGHVYVHGPATLGAWTGRRMVVSRLAAVPGVRVRQRGDSEITVVFPADRLDEVAAILKARRRRRLSPEHKAVAVANLKPFPRTRG